MKKRKRRKNARPRDVIEVKEPRRVGPTPETRDKLEGDALHKLVAAGFLDNAGERAAEEIKSIFLAVCRDVVGKTMRPSVVGRGQFEMSDDMAKAHAERYLPWCRKQRPRIVEATIDLVVERRPPQSMFILEAVVRALQDYASRFDHPTYQAQKKTVDVLEAVL